MKCLALVSAVPIASAAPKATLRRRAATVLLLASATALLSACGGGGGGELASAPPPPVAVAPAPAAGVVVSIKTIPSPATRPGTYDVIAVIDRNVTGSPPDGPPSSRLAGPADLKITTYQPGPAPHAVSYTVEFATPDLPAGLTSLATVVEGQSFDVSANGSVGQYSRDATRGQYPFQFGQEYTATVANPDGSQRVLLSDRFTLARPTQVLSVVEGKAFNHTATLDVGLSHVALGAWGWSIADPNNGGNFIEGGLVRMVYGDRTPASALPATGRASYTATTFVVANEYGLPPFGESGREALRFGLTADFGQRSLSTRITQEFSRVESPDGEGGVQVAVTPGIDLSGTGSLATTGSFLIPLAGTMTGYDPRNLGQGTVAPTTFAVTGTLDGAFFGPQAEQIGGVFTVGQSPGTSLYSEAFVGARD